MYAGPVLERSREPHCLDPWYSIPLTKEHPFENLLPNPAWENMHHIRDHGLLNRVEEVLEEPPDAGLQTEAAKTTFGSTHPVCLGNELGLCLANCSWSTM